MARFDGTSSDDVLRGTVEDDELFGQDGHDTIYGNAGDDTLEGGSGNDSLYGGEGIDYLDGGEGDDYLNPGSSNQWEHVAGSAGNDTIDYSDKGGAYQLLDYQYSDLDAGIEVTIDGENNTGTVDKGASGTDTIVDIASPLDTGLTTGSFGLNGTMFDDVFNLTIGDRQWMDLQGAAGNDTFNLNVLGGTVRLDYRGGDNGIHVNLSEGRTYDDGFGDVDTINGDVRAVHGTDHSDLIIGKADNDSLEGGDGNDSLYGGDGNDSLYGGDGNDSLYGGEGIDYLDGGEGDDYLNPGSSNQWEHVAGSAGNDTIDYSDKGGAYQLLDYQYSDLDAGIEVTIDGENNTGTVDKGASGTDTIVDIASPLDTGLTTGSFGLNGTMFDDVFNLTIGDRQWMDLQGAAGNDTFNLNVLGGTVRLDYRGGDNGIHVNLSEGRTYDDGFGDVDTINGDVRAVHGTDHSDLIIGKADNDSLEGGDGNDSLYGGDGNDSLYGGDGNDSLYGGDGVDQLYGGEGDDYLNPGDNDCDWDYVEGSRGNDTIDYGDNISGYHDVGYDSSSTVWKLNNIGNNELIGTRKTLALRCGDGHGSNEEISRPQAAVSVTTSS